MNDIRPIVFCSASSITNPSKGCDNYKLWDRCRGWRNNGKCLDRIPQHALVSKTKHENKKMLWGSINYFLVWWRNGNTDNSRIILFGLVTSVTLTRKGKARQKKIGCPYLWVGFYGKTWEAVWLIRGIHGNFFKLGISGFQAPATPAAYKSCRNHRRGPGSWKISTGLKRQIFQDMRRGYPFALRKRALSA